MKDPNGNLYQNCTGSADFIPAATAITQPLISGSTFQTSFPISSCDSFANFTLNGLADNNQVSDGHTGAASQWRFSLCSNTTPRICFNTLITITAPSPQNITSTLQAAAAPLTGGSNSFATLTVTSLFTSNGTSNLNGGGTLAGTFSGSPTFSGTPIFSNVPTFPSQSQNLFFASPSGSSGSGSFRALASSDFSASLVPVGSIVPGSNGQCHITSGGASTWGSCAGTAGVQLIGTPFVSSSTVNSATTSQQNLAAACASPPCYSAGVLNALNKTFDLEAGGTVSLVNSSQSMSMGLNIGSNNQIAGTTSINLPTSFGNWWAKLDCVVTTAGSSANLRCMLYFTFVGGTSSQSAWTTIVYNPSSSNGTIDLTTALSPSFWVAFGSASASNSMTQTFAFTHQHN